MSTQLADSFLNEQTAHFLTRVGWQTFTPTLYQNASVASTPIDGVYYVQDGKIHIMATVQATAAGNAGFGVQILIPLPSSFAPAKGVDASIPLGVFAVVDQGTAFYHGYAYYNGILLSSLSFLGLRDGGGGAIGGDPNFALANTDRVSINLTYRLL
jgi:hypothetical protein